MNVAMFWSDGPELYEILTGGIELVNKTYVKVNCGDAKRIYEQLGMRASDENWMVLANEEKRAKWTFGCVDGQTRIGLSVQAKPDELPEIVHKFEKFIEDYISSESAEDVCQ